MNSYFTVAPIPECSYEKLSWVVHWHANESGSSKYARAKEYGKSIFRTVDF